MSIVNKFIEDQNKLREQFNAASAKSVSEFDVLHNNYSSFEKDLTQFDELSILYYNF